MDATLSQTLAQQDVLMLTPAKRVRGQERLSAADKLRSTAVSRVRQPIESLFNWINEKTGIQRASKVRSYRGLLVHVFGRLTAAMLLLAFNSCAVYVTETRQDLQGLGLSVYAYSRRVALRGRQAA